MLSKALQGGVLTALLLASLPASAQVDGQQLFQQHCSKCHGANGNAHTLRGWLLFAQNLSKPKWQANTTDDEILHAIQQGPGAMPAYAEKLSSEEQQALLKHLRSLAKPTPE
ncbi:c-type cytochrome [Pseudomonas sp. 5P_3.1_Bac2]|uniref:c-type cytochrome n=1 Tax=Pseudomonas sp. 5P_3.1_Bac2 TaxID=2971617 RepID=UPI0021C82F8D|nr:cytochrome c [Pseudomonas sp. 5P_3.1_Bac2]MCU1718392.1 cytochrome c [Pseudomonas sp. 5P_3.1_Bac2]